jgi:hypothetical protein
MTKAGVARYRRENPGSKLKTAVTGKVKKGSAAAKRRKSFCARSAGQMKKFPKAAKNVIKTLVVGLSGVALSLVVWILTTLIEVDKRTAVIAAKVDSNNAMLTPLWEDFIRRNGDGNLARIDAKTNIQSSAETEMEQVSQIKSELQAPSWFQRESLLRW